MYYGVESKDGYTIIQKYRHHLDRRVNYKTAESFYKVFAIILFYILIEDQVEKSLDKEFEKKFDAYIRRIDQQIQTRSKTKADFLFEAMIETYKNEKNGKNPSSEDIQAFCSIVKSQIYCQ